MKKPFSKILSVSAALLFAVTLFSCAGDNDAVTETPESGEESAPKTETQAESSANSVEKNVSFRSGINFSGSKRPKVVAEAQYLDTASAENAEEGKIIYAVNSKDAGKIEGWKSQDAGVESREVTAIPKLGYKFVAWSDGVTTASRSGDTEEGVYTAIFDYDILDMPVVVINTADGNDITSKEVYADATFSLIGCEKKYLIDEMPMLIRGRGNNSWSYPKKSYKFKLETKSNLLGIGDGKDRVWVLLANQCDQSLQRNHVTFELGRYFEGIDWEPASTSVEVYLNGEYIGVYLLAEDIKISNHRVDVEEDNIDEIDTGYLLELSNYASGEVIVAAGRTYMIHSDLSEDKTIKNKQRNFIKNYVNDAYEALGSGDFESAAELIDIDSLLATYLTEETVKNLDAQWDSFYIYKDTGGKLFFGPIWDFDLSLGNANEGAEEYTDIFVGNGRGSGGSLGTWFAVAMMQEWFRQLVQDKWLEIYDSICEMPEFILDEGKLGLRSYERNFEKWQIFGTVQNRETYYITSLTSYTEHYEYLAQWLANRLEWLNGAFTNEQFVSEGEGTIVAMMREWEKNSQNRRSSYADDATEKIAKKYDSLANYVRPESIEAPDGFENEGAANLFDSDKNTKYCVEFDGEIEVIFKTKKDIVVKAYLMRTGNDTADYPDRNPDEWAIYGSADKENWVELTTVENGGDELGAENLTWYGFEIDNSTGYKYYKIKLKNSGIMQLSEIRLLGEK